MVPLRICLRDQTRKTPTGTATCDQGKQQPVTRDRHGYMNTDELDVTAGQHFVNVVREISNRFQWSRERDNEFLTPNQPVTYLSCPL